jgi:hypothetical protein
MKVLTACEYSGIVRDAFIKKGHEATSCDFLPTERDGPHYQGDVLDIINQNWDLMIAHPPCTHLAVSGARWFKDKQKEQKKALNFVRKLIDAPIEKIALENPISIISTKIRKPSQIIQPWQFGHPENKRTCFWLKNLPLLEETNNVKHKMKNMSKKETDKIHHMSPGPERGKQRSITYTGIAEAMAEQWG